MSIPASTLTEAVTPLDAAPERITALTVLSLLADDARSNAATRMFNGKPVIAATLARLALCEAVGSAVILVWDDQLAAARIAVGDAARVESVGPRRVTSAMATTSAALRWSDGWRGGLLGTTEFDRGFDAAVIQPVLERTGANAALLVNPAAVLIDPNTLAAMVEKLDADPAQAYAFAAGPVGAAAMVLRRSTVEDLARNKRGPGWLLTYHPDRPTHDPLAKAFAVPIASHVARSGARLTVDGDRQARRIALVLADGESSVESLVSRLDQSTSIDPLPREVTIELTTRRRTRPLWTILSKEPVDERDLALDQARKIFAELAQLDDVRVTFAGTGDPLLHPDFDAIILAAREAGLKALHVETDLLPVDPSAITRLAASGIDIVSFHVPAVHRDTYTKLMGSDRMNELLANVKTFIGERTQRGGSLPILVPTFVKCADNVGEMEQWYDQWIRAVGTAVITAPSDLAGRIPYAGGDDLTPPTRRACRRISNRLTIRSDGSTVPCEEAIDRRDAIGEASNIGQAWTDGLAMLRSLHAERRWDESELCRGCRMWDRP